MFGEAVDVAGYVIVQQVEKTNGSYSVRLCVVWVRRRAHSITVRFDAQSKAIVACLVYLIDLFGLLSLLVAAAHKLAVAIEEY